MKNLQIRLQSFKQVSMTLTCEYERSHLCYTMKAFKYISVGKIAKVTKGCKIPLSSFKGIKVARGVKVGKAGCKGCKILISTFNDIKIWVGGAKCPPPPSRRFLLNMSKMVQLILTHLLSHFRKLPRVF